MRCCNMTYVTWNELALKRLVYVEIRHLLELIYAFANLTNDARQTDFPTSDNPGYAPITTHARYDPCTRMRVGDHTKTGCSTDHGGTPGADILSAKSPDPFAPKKIYTWGSTALRGFLLPRTRAYPLPVNQQPG